MSRTPVAKPKPKGQPQGKRLQSIITTAVFAAIIYAGVSYGPAFFRHLHQSDVETAHADMVKLGNALESYRTNVGSYPTTDEGLAALMASPRHDSNWKGPYLDQAIYTDPWGQHYVYRSPGENGAYDLLSYGADGEPGGQGDDADIYYNR